MRSLSLRRPFESRLQTWIRIWRTTRSRYRFKLLVNRTRRSSRRGVASRRAGSSVADPADDGKVRARRRAGAASPCFPTLGLAQVSLPARPRPHSVLLCVLTPWLSSMAQPDLRLHPVCGRRLSDAAFGPTFDGCQADASGYNIAERRSSRRPPGCSTASALEPAHPPTRAPTRPRDPPEMTPPAAAEPPRCHHRSFGGFGIVDTLRRRR